MNLKLARLTIILTFVALPLCVQAAPSVDARCQIRFRTDAAQPGKAFLDSYTGQLKSVDKDWVCLKTDDGTDVWIPVPVILTLRVLPPGA